MNDVVVGDVLIAETGGGTGTFNNRPLLLSDLLSDVIVRGGIRVLSVSGSEGNLQYSFIDASISTVLNLTKIRQECSIGNYAVDFDFTKADLQSTTWPHGKRDVRINGFKIGIHNISDSDREHHMGGVADMTLAFDNPQAVATNTTQGLRTGAGHFSLSKIITKLPGSNISNYDFRTYNKSVNDNIVDIAGDVIGSLQFDSTITSGGTFIQIADPPTTIPTSKFSIEFYTKFSTNALLFNYDQDGNLPEIKAFISGGHAYLEYDVGVSPSRIRKYAVPSDVDFNIFHHFVITIDLTQSTEMEKFYFNGVLIDSYEVDPSFTPPSMWATGMNGSLRLNGSQYGSTATDSETLKFHRMYEGVLLIDDVGFLHGHRDYLVNEELWEEGDPLYSPTGATETTPTGTGPQPEFRLPSANISNYDFRTYTQDTTTNTTKIMSGGSEIGTIIGAGSVSVDEVTGGHHTPAAVPGYTGTFIQIDNPPPIPAGKFSIEFYTKFEGAPQYFHLPFNYTSGEGTVQTGYASIQLWIDFNKTFVLSFWPYQGGSPTLRTTRYAPFGITDTVHFDNTLHHYVITFDPTQGHDVPMPDRNYDRLQDQDDAGGVTPIGGIENFYFDGVHLEPLELMYNGVGTTYYSILTDEQREAQYYGGTNVYTHLPQGQFGKLYLTGGHYLGAPGGGDTLKETLIFHRMYSEVLTPDEVMFLYLKRASLALPSALPAPSPPPPDSYNCIANYDFRNYHESDNYTIVDENGDKVAEIGSGSSGEVFQQYVEGSNEPHQLSALDVPGERGVSFEQGGMKTLGRYDLRNYGNFIQIDATSAGGPPKLGSSSSGSPAESRANYSIEFYTKFDRPYDDGASGKHTYFTYSGDAVMIEMKFIWHQIEFRITRGGTNAAWKISPFTSAVGKGYPSHPLEISEWDAENFHHFVFTSAGIGIDKDSPKLYIDGELHVDLGTGSYTKSGTDTWLPPDTVFNTLQIGGSVFHDYRRETTRFFRMYNGVLTAEQIKTLYDNRDPHLIFVAPAAVAVQAAVQDVAANGSGNFVRLTNPIFFETDFSIEIYFRMVCKGGRTSPGGGLFHSEVMAETNNESNYPNWPAQFGNYNTDGTVTIRRNLGGLVFTTTGVGGPHTGYWPHTADLPGINMPDNVSPGWGHIVLTHSSSATQNKKLYSEGILVDFYNVGPANGDFLSGARNYNIIGDWRRSGYDVADYTSDVAVTTAYDSNYDEVEFKTIRVYNRVLNASDAASLYLNRDRPTNDTDSTPGGVPINSVIQLTEAGDTQWVNHGQNALGAGEEVNWGKMFQDVCAALDDRVSSLESHHSSP